MTGAAVFVRLSALRENAYLLGSYIGKFYSVLKCDAYGHGICECADALRETGQRFFAVFSLDEALEIKNRVPESEVLILGRTDRERADVLVQNRFIQTVFSSEYASELAPYSNGLRAHIKIDSGMNRCGFKCDADEIKTAFSRFKGNVEGVYTHFHCADASDLIPTAVSLDIFLVKAHQLESMLGKNLVKHSCASAAAIRLPAARLDMSRIGIALYGYLPSNCSLPFSLCPVMSLVAPVISVKTVKKGENIGYGCEHFAEKDLAVATVACGYANGLARSAGRFLRPQINGKSVRIIGNICMDRCMLDVTEILDSGQNVSICDEAVFFGDAAAFSDAEGTIPYEVLTRVGKMNKRIFVN